jgi:[ribosomal protein S5]-alanine N-acetyltransferase
VFFRELETKRMLLRNIAYEDRDFVLDQFSNVAVNTYLYDSEPLADIHDAEEIIEFYLQPEPRPHHRWILVTREGTKIGTCGFHCWNRSEGRCEIGYDLNPDFWGKGFMEEAIRAALRFAENDMKIRRVDACIYPENEKSLKLAERLGFEFTGETRSLTFRGEEYLHIICSLCIEKH